MKLSEFVLNEPRKATVTVTTGLLWWKKVERKRISRQIGAGSWFFVDSGEYTPGFQAENLARAYEAQHE